MPILYLWGSLNNLTGLTGGRKCAYHDGFSHLAPAYLNGIEVHEDSRLAARYLGVLDSWDRSIKDFQCAAELIKSDRCLCKPATVKECKTQIPARILIATLLVGVCWLLVVGSGEIQWAR
jgi:hypothetical protein